MASDDSLGKPGTPERAVTSDESSEEPYPAAGAPEDDNLPDEQGNAGLQSKPEALPKKKRRTRKRAPKVGSRSGAQGASGRRPKPEAQPKQNAAKKVSEIAEQAAKTPVMPQSAQPSPVAPLKPTPPPKPAPIILPQSTQPTPPPKPTPPKPAPIILPEAQPAPAAPPKPTPPPKPAPIILPEAQPAPAAPPKPTPPPKPAPIILPEAQPAPAAPPKPTPPPKPAPIILPEAQPAPAAPPKPAPPPKQAPIILPEAHTEPSRNEPPKKFTFKAEVPTPHPVENKIESSEPGKQVDAGQDSVTGSSHAMVATQPTQESEESHKDQELLQPVLKWDILKGMLVIFAIIAILAVSLFYTQSHNTLKGILHTTISTTSLGSASSPNSTETAIITKEKLSVQASNVLYSGNSIIEISGSVSPAPSVLGSNVLVYVKNPQGNEIYATELPLSLSGHFGTNVIGGENSTWINGTYTITSNYLGSSASNTFSWVPPPQPLTVPGKIIVTLCHVYTSVRNDIFLLCIILMLLGAGMYSIGHMMAGSHKGQFQNYGMGMMIGSLIGIGVAVSAPYVLRVLVGNALPIASCAINPL